MAKTNKLLGIEFEEIGNSLFIHQRSYIRRLCEIYEKYKYPVSSLPISKGQVLSKLDSPKTSEEILTFPYRNLIGSLSFIAIRTRPDIMYAVNVLSQFQANPGIKHWNCLLRLLGYLKYSQEYKLELSKVKSLKLRCYSDSDFATNRDDRLSMGGFITFIDETPISWRTFKQKSVSLSTMEAEYVSLTEAAKEFIWLKNVINNKSLNLELSENVMFCDNQAAISFSKSQFELEIFTEDKVSVLTRYFGDKKMYGAVVPTRRRNMSHSSCHNRFIERQLLISLFGPVNWPPRSCDLTPLDYFLWGYVKSLVYADKSQMLDHLEDNIRRVIADIRPQMLEKSHRKLDVQIGLHLSQPWQSYARNHV
ncbi:retrovirus-related Pol polyprotein from transposon TNT 1-94 [Trichonephila clavipes]|nr:retrovirus-related Pol polyprotein from transposon TNT 1-94 [Trichonephila clavipes]